MATDFAGTLIVLQSRSGYVTAHDTLDRKNFGALYQHRSPAQFISMCANRLRHFVQVRRQQVMGNDVPELAEPKPRQCRKYFALSFDWCGRNAIESRDAIGRDD